MPEPGTEPNHSIPSDPLTEPFDEDSFGDPETTETEKDDDPAGGDDFPAMFGSDLKAD